ncbi:MAG: hypothetical protein R2856_29450 [Caldilineaceae bacterium]
MQAGIKAQDRVESLEKRRSLRAYDVIEGVRHSTYRCNPPH